MRSLRIAVTALTLLVAGNLLALGQTTPPYGAGNSQKQGQQKGKKMGPRDGSGPLHPPGTGGGTGAGQRKGRR